MSLVFTAQSNRKDDRGPEIGSAGNVRGNWLEDMRSLRYFPDITQRSPFRYFKTSPVIIRLAVMLYIRFPLSLRNVVDL